MLKPFTALCVLLLPVIATASEPTFPFQEDFGAGAAERWQPFAGEWQFADGVAKQASGDYDCGATVAVQPKGPYAVSVRYRPTGHFNGAGVFFALPTLERKHGGMMVRCDPGERVLWGWFDEDGVFQFQGEAVFDGAGEGEQTLAVVVDPEKRGFNVYHNDERVVTNQRTDHLTGYVGIQTSGGPHEFLNFEVRPATEAELAGIKAPGKYSRIVDVIGDIHGVIALRRDEKCLVQYGPDGQELAAVNAADIPGVGPDGLNGVALGWDGQGPEGRQGFYVIADNGKSIYHFDPEMKPVGVGPLFHDLKMKAMGVAARNDGYFFVSDAALPGLRVFTREGEQTLKYGEAGNVPILADLTAENEGHFKTPRGVAVNADGDIVVADREAYAYQVYRYDATGNEMHGRFTGPWMPYPEHLRFDHAGNLLVTGTYEYYRSYGALRVMHLDGRGEKVFTGHAVGDLSDHVRTCQGPGGNYYIVDQDQDRIIVLPADFQEQMPKFAWTDDGGVQITITKVDGTQAEATTHEKTEDGQRVLVRQPEPVCVAWPPFEPEELTTYALPPKPPAGKTYVIDMPVLVCVFPEMINEKGEKVSIDPNGVVDRLKREYVAERKFYWFNSHLLLNKQYEFMVMDGVVPEHVGAWITPDAGRRIVNEARVARGLEPIGSYHSLVTIQPMPGFDPNTTDEMGMVSGGGLTVPAYSGYSLWNHGQGWLMAHEWGHQLDSYFDLSGMPDWWLNHPDGTVHIGVYGEHWDCNAFLCRRVDKMNWLRFVFGKLRLVGDHDEDGVPDNDPTLPLDEARFGSDASLVDSDRDGLDDFAEMTAGTFTPANPQSLDSDADGLEDAVDPVPQYAVASTLAAVTPDPNGVVMAKDHRKLGTIQRGWCDLTVFGGYDPDYVYLFVVLLKPAQSINCTVDFNHDGWFTGRDNVYATVNLAWPEGEEPVVKGARGCEAEVRQQLVGTSLRVKIPRPAACAPLAPGKSIGMTFRASNGGGTIQFLADPWQIVGLTLK